MDIVLFGIQGSGKGTQAKLIAAKYNLTIFEMGAELRKLAAEDTPLGHRVKTKIDAGHLVTADIVIDLVKKFLHSLPAGQHVLFDGIPRTMLQKALFDQILYPRNHEIVCINIVVPKDKVIERLLKRAEIEHRSDDNMEVIKKRILTFYTKTTPVIEYYRDDNTVFDINGDQPIDIVSNEIFKELDFYFNNPPQPLKRGTKIVM